MIRPEYLNVNNIITDKAILQLFKAVADHGGVLRFVGGSVRDTLAGLKGFELDLATDLTPEELVEACQDNGLKTVPIGIKFATTGVMINNKVVAVSSLYQQRDGYKFSSDFNFTDDWKADASKRDLTINAVYADEHGNVFDYYNGIDDLEKGVIRFIGNADEQIKNDPIRIMRFFRFYSIFGKGEPDLKSLKACVENRELLRTVAIEQVRDELFKILLTPNIVKTLRIIFENDILSYILPVSKHLQELQNLSDVITQNELNPDALRRLFVMYFPDGQLAENLAMRLHLSKEQKNRLVHWSHFDIDVKQLGNVNYMQKAVYLYGKDFCKDKILFYAAQNMDSKLDIKSLFAQIDALDVPQFPISGIDLISLGIINNAQIGELLNILKNEWIQSNFTLSNDNLVNLAKTFASKN